jgi:gamma-glutamylcyclotransferase (GGCT)/AIG2-like uncharacterized protein YtfP
MIDYRSYIESAIRRGDYVLSVIEERIDRLWVDDKLSNDDRDELIQLAAENARDVFQTDTLDRLAALELRVYNLENPVDQFPVWQKGQTSIKGQVYRFDVTGDGELDLVRYDGGRQSTSLSIGKIEGWHMLDRELNIVATISKDADGNFLITPIPEPEPEPTEDVPVEE